MINLHFGRSRTQMENARTSTLRELKGAFVYTFDDHANPVGKVTSFTYNTKSASITVLSDGERYTVRKERIWGITENRMVFLMFSRKEWENFKRQPRI